MFMRVAFYNQMFGLNGRSLISYLVGHWAVHFQGSIKKAWKRVNVDRTVDLIKKSKADIIGIAEVLEGRERVKRKIK